MLRSSDRVQSANRVGEDFLRNERSPRDLLSISIGLPMDPTRFADLTRGMLAS